MSTIKVNKIENTSTTAGGIEVDTSGHVKIDGQQLPTAGPLSNRNLIINGAMVHDQRSNGAVFNTTGPTYGTCDRWSFQYSQSSKYTGQQVSDGPAGFEKSLKATVTNSTSVGSVGYFVVEQSIEGYNTSSLAWGSADAKAISISFWVKASVTGTYSLALRNADYTRTRVEEYTIQTANTWEYKTITVPGDTTGTYNTTNGVGIRLLFDLGVGTAYSGTAGVWNAGNKFSTSNSVHLIETQGATWQITGVQLEVGTKSTPFEHRSYSDELARCQRYCQVLGGDSFKQLGGAMRATTTTAKGQIKLVTAMRATPTGSTIGSGSFTFQSGDDILSADVDFSSLWTAGSDHNVIWADWAPGSGTFGGSARDYGMMYCKNGTSRKLVLSAEL